MQEKAINVTIGTAGHIDHGKTALVKLLTGCQTDTLKAEKERGMSIDLGFAPCTVAGLKAGIVDVPGHEHFVKTMVAGASGMDAVILVVAADDGVMPQTREHLDILTLLGVREGLTVLTKIDRVPGEKVEARRGELAGFLKGTFLESAPICPLSNVTGEGFDGFHGALSQLVRGLRAKSPDGVFRLPVDRAFSPKGFGTVVTGIPVSGRVKTGDEVVLLPEGLVGRMNSIQVYGEDSDTALAGQCAALNVRRWDAKTIQRGNTVAAPGYFEPLVWYACRLRLLQGLRAALKNAAQVRFHTGTAESAARVYLMEGQQARPGDEVLVQVRLDKPVVAGPADRFIIRSLSPVTTVGGGMIIEGLEGKTRRSPPGVLEDLKKRAAAVRGERDFVLYCVEAAGLSATTGRAVARRVKLPEDRVREILQETAREGTLVALPGDLWVNSQAARAAEADLVGVLERFHRDAPESAGMAAETLLAASGLPERVFDGLLGRLESEGTATSVTGRIALAGHRVRVSEEDREVFEEVEAVFRKACFHPPSVDGIIAETGFEAARVKKAVGSFLERGILVRVAEGLFFHGEAVEEARGKLVDFIRREGRLESVKFKYLLDTTRKYAIPLLDYFDSAGLTVRVGNTRYLKER